MMRCFLSTVTINRINLCVNIIDMQFFYYLVFYIGQKYFNILKNVLCIEKSVVNQLIKLNKSGNNLKKKFGNCYLKYKA